MDPTPHRHTIGLTRREMLQVGYSDLLGVGLSSLLLRRANAGATAPADATFGKAKSVVIVFCTGGPSHLETFDPKPDGPAEIRGEYKTIATSVAGVQFSEHVPQLAARADKFTLVRSLSHPETNHLLATHRVLTGTAIPGGKFDQVASRNDWPDYAGGFGYLKPRTDGVPAGVNLPTFLVEGPLTWPGQHAGFLGPRFDPWQVRQDPNKPDFKVDGLRLTEGLAVERLTDRRTLLETIDRAADAKSTDGGPFGDIRDRAFSMLSSGKVAEAFEIGREPDKVRDRYGRHQFGQSLLLARRLVQAGVPVVQANMGNVQNWDSHGDIFNRLKNDLLPPLDRGVSALLDDLAALGLLDETLVMVTGEFGRTPKLQGNKNEKPGRDHWPSAFSALFAGAGVRGGQVLGKTDKVGAYPTTPPYAPDDIGATVYHALGVDHEADIVDQLGRPVRLNRGTPMTALYTG
jgi:uncharacterized protein (DUF1501 family)